MHGPDEIQRQRSASKAPAASVAAPVVFASDDDISVRESPELLIRSAGWQLQEFGSTRPFRARPRVCEPSRLLLDVSRADLHGLDLQRQIVADRADMPIIFISGYPDVPVTVRAKACPQAQAVWRFAGKAAQVSGGGFKVSSSARATSFRLHH